LVHRDLKPANILTSNASSKQAHLYLIDLGLAAFYLTSDNQLMPQTCGHAMTGTPRFASINAHRGLRQSPRDDLESLAYILIFLYRGSLPWQGLHSSIPQEKMAATLKMKESIPLDVLARDIPCT
jgi:serine/threonine protein kinase